jgi:hypothetical protein
VTPADHYIHHGVLVFDVTDVAEIGRRRGLEIRVVAKENGSSGRKLAHSADHEALTGATKPSE